MREWIYSGGRTTSVAAAGTYTVGQDCTLSLTFGSTGNTSTGGATFQAPTSFRATLDSSSSTGQTGQGTQAGTGSVIIQPVSLNTIIGRFVAQ